jgi:hypothetical protein
VLAKGEPFDRDAFPEAVGAATTFHRILK